MEYLGNLLLLIVGGNDTTRNTMSGSVYSLSRFPDEFTKLKANPSLIPQMVAEVIRWQTPLAYMRRTANHDIEIGGKQIKKNDQILMWYSRTQIVLTSNAPMRASICLSDSAFTAAWVIG